MSLEIKIEIKNPDENKCNKKQELEKLSWTKVNLLKPCHNVK